MIKNLSIMSKKIDVIGKMWAVKQGMLCIPR